MPFGWGANPNLKDGSWPSFDWRLVTNAFRLGG